AMRRIYFMVHIPVKSHDVPRALLRWSALSPVRADTPPAFFRAGESDSAIAAALPGLHASIRGAGGTVELHILAGVGQGSGIREGNPAAVANWLVVFVDWLDARQMLTRRSVEAQITPRMQGGTGDAKPIPVYPPWDGRPRRRRRGEWPHYRRLGRPSR
ncbi:MAG: hypothetical protein ABI587_12400, partial [Gemmatimonadales bacterium]